MTNLEKAIQDAEKDLQKFVKREDWSTANQKQGYLLGVKAYAHIKDSMEKQVSYMNDAQAEAASAIKSESYGDAAHYRSYISGMVAAETAHRLDVLQAMESA